MRFSVKSHSKLYFLLFFAITFYFLGDFIPFSSVDEYGNDLTVAYGQLDNDDKNEKQGLSPNTTINSAIDGNNNGIANNGSTTSDTMKFSFSGRDSQGANIYRFECSMDGKLFVTCVSTNTVNVGRGTHTFSVRSEDNTGNKDSTPSSFTWTVNSETSNTQIDFATDGNKAAIVNGSNTSSNSMTFAFSGTDNHGAAIYRFECSMDRGAFGSCVSTNTVNVGDGTHTFSVRSEDNAGNKDSTPASFTWTVDTTPPMTSIISAIDGNNNTISDNGNSESTSIRFNFSGTDTGGVGVDHLECNIDNSKYVACTSPFVFPNLLKDGIHTFTVLSEDNAGNKDSTPASFTWTVDTTPPMTSIISAIDGNNNTISDNGNSESTSIRFNFSGTDTGGAGVDHLECNIDNSKYVACTSPFVFPNLLKDGIHTFTVLSEDNTGNKDSTPASFTWTVDTTPPMTSIISAIDGNNNTISDNGNSESTSIRFNFSGTDTGGAGVDHLECNIDNSKYVACTSPFVFPNLLKDGIHTFTVLSEDNAGNKDSTPASFTWTVDTTPPMTSIISAIDGNNNTISDNGNSESTSIRFNFSGTDTGGAGVDHLECNIDNSKYVACTSPFVFPNLLKDGIHTFTVTSEDNAGNKDSTPASFTWTVDTTPPMTSIISAIDGNNNTISDNGNSESTSIRFNFSGTDTGGAGVDHLECNIDNSKYVACTSPFVFLNILKDGIHTFNVRSIDRVGNINLLPASFTWTIDTISPNTTLESATDGNKIVMANGTNTNSKSMSFEFSANDTGGDGDKGVGINHFVCNIDNSKYVACTSPFVFPNLLKDGIHTFTVISEDNAGNKDSTPTSFSWIVDTSSPLISINTATDGNGNLLSNDGNTSSNSATISFTGNDTGGKEGKGVGIKEFKCSLDGASFSICTSPVQFTSVNLPEGTHSFQIIAEDGIGNIDSSPQSFNWTVDTEPPDITVDSATDGYQKHITSGGNSSSDSIIFEFTALDNGGREGKGVGTKQFECKIDNSDFVSCTSPVEFTNLSNGVHTLDLLSEDNVGNISPTPESFNWTVDTVSPTTTINKAIVGTESSLTNGSNSRFNSITFTFAGNDTDGLGIREFECSLDDSNFTTCTSPLHYNDTIITDGPHDFKVFSKDNVGNNDLSPELFTWNVDTIPPTTNITKAMDGNNITITNSSNTKSNSVIFEFSGNDTGGVGVDHLECSLDGATFTACTSPVQFSSADILDGTQ